MTGKDRVRKRQEILAWYKTAGHSAFAMTWTDLEGFMLSKMSQRDKIPCDRTYT